MEEYYIYVDGKQEGPFTLEQLTKFSISTKTLIWFEGQSDWKPINEIDELKVLLKSVPPPIREAFQVSQQIPNEQENELSVEDSYKTILGLSKNNFYAISGIIILVIIVLVFNSYQKNSQEKLNNINKATELHNQQLEEQGKEIEAQQARIDEQERIEAEREKQAIDNRLFEIRNLLTVNEQELEKAKIKLNDATSFKLLRSSSERHAQIQAAQNEVDFYKEEIRKLEEEFKNINPYK